MSDYKELVRKLRGQAKQDGYTEYEAADALEKLSAEVERLNGYILAMHTDVVTPLRAELERYRESDLSEAVQRLDETKDAEIERLKRERDEARSYADLLARSLVSPETREKAKALDELEAFLRSDSVPGIWIEPRAESDEDPVYFAVIVDRTQIDEEGPTIAAAIRAALEKARGA